MIDEKRLNAYLIPKNEEILFKASLSKILMSPDHDAFIIKKVIPKMAWKKDKNKQISHLTNIAGVPIIVNELIDPFRIELTTLDYSKGEAIKNFLTSTYWKMRREGFRML